MATLTGISAKKIYILKSGHRRLTTLASMAARLDFGQVGWMAHDRLQAVARSRASRDD